MYSVDCLPARRFCSCHGGIRLSNSHPNGEQRKDSGCRGRQFDFQYTCYDSPKGDFYSCPRSCNKAAHEVASFDEKELQINQNVSGNVHEEARQGRGSEAAAKPCGHVWGLGRCDPGRPLRSSLPLR
ncbi:hypothetical protein L3X38_043534 [Prunus dulcis]|uniref:Uncharacterized protein n=1 Tax=Prunus dulcis TaxID=3755 RepID=A0AAD4UXA3_PRUDU|nr:hypothetical protein L3X38_043534 [Prunus dulcis]